MTEVLPRIEKLGPRVTVELIPNLEGFEALERGEIDLAITPARYLSSAHPSERIGTSPIATLHRRLAPFYARYPP